MCAYVSRAKFLKQLVQLVEQRDAVVASTSLRERKSQLAALTLPGPEENLPGVHLEDLGYVMTVGSFPLLVRRKN